MLEIVQKSSAAALEPLALLPATLGYKDTWKVRVQNSRDSTEG